MNEKKEKIREAIKVLEENDICYIVAGVYDRKAGGVMVSMDGMIHEHWSMAGSVVESLRSHTAKKFGEECEQNLWETFKDQVDRAAEERKNSAEAVKENG